MVSQKFIVGFLLVTLLASGIAYVELSDKVKIRVDNDKSTIYVPHEDYNWMWVVGGREYNRLFDGTSIMRRDRSSVTVDTTITGNTIKILRNTDYQRGPSIRDTYLFDGALDSVEMVPISHTVEVFNASGYFYRYTVDGLTGVPEKTKLTGETELSFGRNIKVNLHPGYRWAWIGYPYGSDSLSAQYDIDSDYEVFEVRLFDPIWWNFTFRQRDSFQINTSTTETDYQLLLNVTYDSDMQSDFSDIRFTDEDGNELSYWIESKVDSSYANVWIKASIDTNNESKYMYFDNYSAVVSDSNGSNVFEEFFDKDSTSGWTTGGSLTVTTSTDYLRFYDTTAGNKGSATRYDLVLPTDYIMETRFKTVSLGVIDQTQFMLLDGSTSDKKSWAYIPSKSTQDKWYYYQSGAYPGGDFTEGTEYIFKLYNDDSACTAKSNYYLLNLSRSVLSSATGKNCPAGTPTDTDGIYIGDGTTSGECDFYARWILFRKYMAVEPTYSFSGSASSGGGIYIDSNSSDQDIEQGSTVTVYAMSTTPGGTVCIYADHGDIGDNYTCGVDNVSFSWDASSNIRKFNDSLQTKQLNFTSASTITESLYAIRNGSEIETAYLDMTGIASDYARDVTLDLDADGTIDWCSWGEIQASTIVSDEFNNSAVNQSVTFTDRGVMAAYLRLPQDMNVTSATLDIYGDTNDNYSNDYSSSVFRDSDGYYTTISVPTIAYNSNDGYMYLFGCDCGDTPFTAHEKNITMKHEIDGHYRKGVTEIKTDVPWDCIHSNAVYKTSTNSGIYLYGGYDGSASNTASDNMYHYNTATDTWTAKTSMPYKKYGHQSVLVDNDDKIYICGGYNDTGDWNKSCFYYDISANAFTHIADLPRGLEYGWAEQLNTTHLLFYGGTRETTTGSFAGATYMYNIAGDSWATMDYLPAREYAIAGAKIGDDVYSFGGYHGGTKGSVYRYDAVADDWETLDSMTYDWVYQGTTYTSNVKFTNDECAEVDNHIVCYGAGGLGSQGQQEYIMYFYPNSVSMLVEDYDTISESYSGDLTGKESIGDLKTEINDQLQTCTADADGYCDLSLHFGNYGAGTINASNLEITTDIPQIDLGTLTVSCLSEDDSDTVLYLKLNNDTAYGDNGTNAYDYSQTGNNGTISGATWTTSGKYDSALSFDGTNDYINCSQDSSLEPATSITISVWVYKNEHSKEYVVTKYYSSKGYIFGSHPTSPYKKYRLKVFGTAGSNKLIYTASDIPIDTWTNIIATFDAGAIHIYVNGILDDGTISGGATDIVHGAYDLFIGKYTTTYFNGTIDEVIIWDRALSADEIADVYAQTFIPKCEVPIDVVSSEAGVLNMTNLSIGFLGTSSIYFSRNDTDGNSSELYANIYYSDWDYTLANSYEFIEFIPSTPTSDNVTPYGQSSATPMMNITTENSGGKNMSWYFKVNETYACVDLTISNSSTHGDGHLMDGTWFELYDNVDDDTNFGIWMWADYSCSYSTWKLWEPTFYFRGCCEDCTCSESVS